MMRNISSVADIVRWRMCVGCGACAYICPEQAIRLVDIPNEGIRPRIVSPQGCASCSVCLQVCPAHSLDYSKHSSRPGILREASSLFGPVLEIWEGHASDPEIRFKGSSGGALTALGLFAIERLGMYGVLQVGSDPDNPIRNITRLSTTRSDLLEKTGSRYAPAAACENLDRMENAPAPCVFVGQPAEVAALEKTRLLRPDLHQKIGLTLSFFCAGSPSTQGTLDLLKMLGVSPEEVDSLRYRGNGWPGFFAPTLKTRSEPVEKLSYRESWRFLQKYRPYSIHLWPDDTGEAADISCGDPWYQEPDADDCGSSLVVVRTELGREMVRGAVAAGYLSLSPAATWKLFKSQENLSNKRRAVAGRRLAFRLFGIPVTHLRGLPIVAIWFGLPFRDKMKSFFGTIRRIIRRKYYRPFAIH